MTARAIDRASATRLAAELRDEVAQVDKVVGHLREALAKRGLEAQDVVTVHGVGGLVHDFYTGIEKALARTAPALNGALPQGDAWHRELLHAMTLDLPGLRPAVFHAETERILVEYLKFRHLYRNMYGFSLDWSRVRTLAQGAVDAWPRVKAELGGLLGFLDAVVSAPLAGRPWPGLQRDH
jgi:hypothetical protein